MSQWARNNPDQARREAYAADMAMEEYLRQQDEAAQEVFAEMDNDCRNALREV